MPTVIPKPYAVAPESPDISGGLVNKGSLKNVPEFLKPALEKAQTRIVAGEPGMGTTAHVRYGDPSRIYSDEPAFVDQPVLSHEATHVFQNSLKNPEPYTKPTADVYDYGGWQGLIDARKQGKTMADFNLEQQATMLEDYQRLQQRLKAIPPSANQDWIQQLPPQNRARMLKQANMEAQQDRQRALQQWDLANQAVGPYIHQLGAMPLKGDTSTTINTAPPSPAPPPAAQTGIAKPLPEVGGPAIDLSAGFIPRGATP